MKNKITLFHWIPRVLCILAILTISSLALDSFGPGQNFGRQVGAFFMQMIPSFVLVILLVIAWKWEYLGGFIIMVLAILMTPIVFIMNYRHNHSVAMSLGIICVITLPFIITGILFIISHKMKEKAASQL
jgi:hypothetical protein